MAGRAPAPPVAPAGAPRPVPDGPPAGGDSRASAALPGTAASRPRIMPQPVSLRSRNAGQPGWSSCLRRPLRNEFGAASRQSLALGPGSHSAYAACARESSGGMARASTALSRKPATQRSGVEGDPGPSARNCREAAPDRLRRAPRPPRRAHSQPRFHRPNRPAPRTGTRAACSYRAHKAASRPSLSRDDLAKARPGCRHLRPRRSCRNRARQARPLSQARLRHEVIP